MEKWLRPYRRCHQTLAPLSPQSLTPFIQTPFQTFSLPQLFQLFQQTHPVCRLAHFKERCRLQALLANDVQDWIWENFSLSQINCCFRSRYTSKAFQPQARSAIWENWVSEEEMSFSREIGGERKREGLNLCPSKFTIKGEGGRWNKTPLKCPVDLGKGFLGKPSSDGKEEEEVWQTMWYNCLGSVLDFTEIEWPKKVQKYINALRCGKNCYIMTPSKATAKFILFLRDGFPPHS